MTKSIEVADRIQGEHRDYLSSLAFKASYEVENGDINFKTARKIALRHEELTFTEETLDILTRVLVEHYGLRNKSNKNSRKYLRDFGSLVMMEERYGIDGRISAADFNNFQARTVLTEQVADRCGVVEEYFDRFANLCYGAVIVNLSESLAKNKGVKQEKVGRIITKGLMLTAESVVGVGSDRFNQLVNSDDIYLMVLKFQRLGLSVFQALRENSWLDTRLVSLSSSDVRLSRLLIRKGMRRS